MKKTIYELSKNKELIYEDTGKTAVNINTNLVEITIKEGEDFKISLIEKMHRSYEEDKNKLASYLNKESEFYSQDRKESYHYWCSPRGQVVLQEDRKNKLLSIAVYADGARYSTQNAIFLGIIASGIQGRLFDSNLWDIYDDISSDKRCIHKEWTSSSLIICNYNKIATLPVDEEIIWLKSNQILNGRDNIYGYCDI